MGEGCALLPYLIAYFGVKAIIHLDDSITHGHNNVIITIATTIIIVIASNAAHAGNHDCQLLMCR